MGALAIVGATDPVRRTLETSGVAGALVVVDSVPAAVAALDSSADGNVTGQR